MIRFASTIFTINFEFVSHKNISNFWRIRTLIYILVQITYGPNRHNCYRIFLSKVWYPNNCLLFCTPPLQWLSTRQKMNVKLYTLALSRNHHCHGNIATFSLFNRRVRKFSKKRLLILSCPSVRQSFLMEQLGSHQTDIHEIWYLSMFRKSVEKIHVILTL